MADYPALPLWTDAYLGDAGHLTDAEHGVYFQLMMLAWRTPGCHMPNDAAWIARRFRRSVEEYEKTIKPVLEEFWNCDGNWWTQKRLTKEHRYLSRRAKAQSVRAKARWGKNKTASPDDAEPMPEPCSPASAGQCPDDAPTPTPTPQKKETPPNGGSKKPEVDLIEAMPPFLNATNRKKAGNGSKRGTRLEATWRPDEQDCEFARSCGLDAGHVAERYRDYWIGVAGAKGVKLDWPSTWRNWCRREAERLAERPGDSGSVAAVRSLMVSGE